MVIYEVEEKMSIFVLFLEMIPMDKNIKANMWRKTFGAEGNSKVRKKSKHSYTGWDGVQAV